MTKKKPVTVRAATLGFLREAKGWCDCARKDVLRADRIDALDSIRGAINRLREAESAIKETMK